MTLWTELSGERTAMLPQAHAELTATPSFEVPKTVRAAAPSGNRGRRSFRRRTRCSS